MAMFRTTREGKVHIAQICQRCGRVLGTTRIDPLTLSSEEQDAGALWLCDNCRRALRRSESPNG